MEQAQSRNQKMSYINREDMRILRNAKKERKQEIE